MATSGIATISEFASNLAIGTDTASFLTNGYNAYSQFNSSYLNSFVDATGAVLSLAGVGMAGRALHALSGVDAASAAGQDAAFNAISPSLQASASVSAASFESKLALYEAKLAALGEAADAAGAFAQSPKAIQLMENLNEAGAEEWYKSIQAARLSELGFQFSAGNCLVTGCYK